MAKASIMVISFLVGQFCEMNYNDCDPNPCENGGECVDLLNAYRCECLSGYSGTNCEVDINECLQPGVQCQNGALCIDKVRLLLAHRWGGLLKNLPFENCDRRILYRLLACRHI